LQFAGFETVITKLSTAAEKTVY